MIIPPIVNLPQNTKSHTDRKSVVTPPSSNILITHSSGTLEFISSKVSFANMLRVFFPMVIIYSRRASTFIALPKAIASSSSNAFSVSVADEPIFLFHSSSKITYQVFNAICMPKLPAQRYLSRSLHNANPHHDLLLGLRHSDYLFAYNPEHNLQ